VKQFVLDASFALSWVIETERTPSLYGYYQALGRKAMEAVVPAIWPTEVANVLLTLERQRKLSAVQILDWIGAFEQLPIDVRPPSIEQSLGGVRAFAQSWNLTGYDAEYLYLAMRDNIPLATRDKQLLSVAPRVGVKLVNVRN
jgi:predicted nucleic acid-binding protein